MSEKTETEHLRKLLDERGVEWGATDTYRLLVTSWNDASGHSWAFMEHRNGSFSKLTAYHLTPEQAIAASLGRGTCHNTQTDFDFQCSECRQCLDNGRMLGVRYCPRCGRKVVDE